MLVYWAQGSSVEILKNCNDRQTQCLIGHMESENAMDSDMLTYLSLCISMANEKKNDQRRYTTFSDLCETIIKRQTNRERIKKYEVQEALSIKLKDTKDKYGNPYIMSSKQRGRLEDGTAKLRIEHIEGLCSGFKNDVVKRFWTNELLLFSGEIPYPFAENESIEIRTLKWIVEKLNTDGEWNLVKANLDQCIIAELNQNDIPEKTCAVGENPVNLPIERCSLYSAIQWYSQNKNIRIEDLWRDILEVDVNTWYRWERSWKVAEEENFCHGVPRNHINRIGIMMLCVSFELDYGETVHLLSLAGYKVSDGEPDATLIRYFSKELSKDQMLQYLRNITAYN